MYKVLLVDDEILDLKGMQTFIPWEELGMEVVAAVSSGFAASELLEGQPVDILVTDVHMPNMSGLELARKALDTNEKLKIIFVSGYQDFHYVKQALYLNACSYVLKPMDDNELIESLKKLRDELDEQRKRQETEQQYRRMVPLIKNEYLVQLLEGVLNSEALEVLLEEYKLNETNWPVRVVIAERDDWKIKRGAEDVMDEAKMSGVFWNTLSSVCRRLGIQQYCRLNDKRLGLLLESAVKPEYLHEVLSREFAETPAPVTVTLGVGDQVTGVLFLKESYRQAKAALDYKMFNGKGSIIHYQQAQTARMKDVQNLDIQLDSLFEAMTNYDLVRIHDELHKLYGLAVTMRSKYTIQNFTIFLLMKLDAYLQKMNEDLFQLLNIDIHSLDVVLQYETIGEIHAWLQYQVYELSEILHSKKQKKNWKLVRDIVNDVKQRLHENISLKDIAEQYSFSPNYLGQIFKEEMNTNFSDYITTLRMEKAGDLLLHTNLKVYEIANMIGYRYLPYFSRQFKDYYAKTPLEYRRKL
ncbi:response regulator [Paenibacillus sp. MAHUQ-46]|uniref:Response regulator n=2 Tax=Paenibacillus TaxID=44249 RepID=A0A934JAE9_9BACL|nr:response regulator [Paenibacillus roseus]MBJ6363230.1 response regulator [Paenibacillus roseus]